MSQAENICRNVSFAVGHIRCMHARPHRRKDLVGYFWIEFLCEKRDRKWIEGFEIEFFRFC